MTIPKNSEHARVSIRPSSAFVVFVVGTSLVAIVATFLLANSALDLMAKTTGFGAIVSSFLFVCLCLNWAYSSRQRHVDQVAVTERDNEIIDRGLRSLDEATSFFAGSLRSSDAFRLVSSRVRDLLPFRSIVLYLLDETRSHLVCVEAEGVAAAEYKSKTLNFSDELAGQCYSNRQVEIDHYLEIDQTQRFGSSVAIPLCRDTGVFGVLQLFFEADYDLVAVERLLFEAIATRVAPTVLSSIAFERSQLNALTDITTDLPNERAFYLVLENQVAETQRKPESRPLTILSIDIKGFDEINQKFGHGTGDRVLKFVAQIVKDNLRQMDFFARSLNDEFLAVLPTATREVSHEIIARIHTGFFGRKMKLTDTESIEIELNIGWAAFGNDGETPGQLLSLAQLRKEQLKSTDPKKVLIFPQEHVH